VSVKPSPIDANADSLFVKLVAVPLLFNAPTYIIAFGILVDISVLVPNFVLFLKT
jgi:hypothetical protein